jgi:hypothetical protein
VYKTCEFFACKTSFPISPDFSYEKTNTMCCAGIYECDELSCGECGRFAYLLGEGDLTELPKIWSNVQTIKMEMFPGDTKFRQQFAKENYVCVKIGGDVVQLGPTSTYDVVYTEFQKFMMLNAVALKMTGVGLVASPTVDRMWRLALTYSKGYMNTCRYLKPISGLDLVTRTDPTLLDEDVLER